MKQLCETCEKRPAKMFRRSYKYRGRKSNLVIKSDRHHSSCRRCWSSMYESVIQAPYKWQ